MGPLVRRRRQHRRYRLAGASGHHRILARRQAEYGTGGSAGPIVTAGWLVFIGSTTDHRFRAIDSKTGKELWVAKLPANANANPMTYEANNGKQYVAVVATNSVQVFALP